MLLSSTAIFPQTSEKIAQKNTTSLRTDIAPALLSATPGIEEIKLALEPIPEKLQNKSN